MAFTWAAPVANGTPITAYKVYIRQADYAYVIDTTACNGGNTVVVANTQCTLPLSKLTSAPFSLLKGYSIYIKVIATNAYGDSLISDAGNGGLIVFVPDAPINLVDNPDVTSSSVISFSWNDPSNNGGQPILDYRVSYD